MHPMPSWVKSMVEEVAHKFNVKIPTIYQEMKSNRQFNPLIAPTCTNISLDWGNLIIGDRLIAKLDKKELELLTMRAFVYAKNWYAFKKISLIATLLFLNAYVFNNDKVAPIKAVTTLFGSVIAYLGFNIYAEKYIDREIIKEPCDQLILDLAYQKISPNKWPLSKWPSFYKNVARYINI